MRTLIPNAEAYFEELDSDCQVYLRKGLLKKVLSNEEALKKQKEEEALAKKKAEAEEAKKKAEAEATKQKEEEAKKKAEAEAEAEAEAAKGNTASSRKNPKKTEATDNK